jgi:hypothetical protein
VSVQATEAGPAPRVSGWSQRQRVSFRQASGSGVREVAIQLAATAREAPIFFFFLWGIQLQRRTVSFSSGNRSSLADDDTSYISILHGQKNV